MTQDVSLGWLISRLSLRVIGIRFLAAAVFLAAAARQADATTIAFSAIDLNFTVAERSLFSGAVAVFEDDNPAAGPGDFVATIDWGDATSSTGTIVLSSAAFTVLGSHTYLDEGAFTVTVTVKDQPPAGSATTTYTATVTEADSLSGTPVTFSTLTGVSFTGVVANFSDTLLSANLGDFTATINWGDATTSAGTITGGGGSFQVSGTHTYVGSGTFSVVVTLTDDAPGTATAQVTSTARVSNVMTITSVSFSVPEATLFNSPIATFTDSDTTKTPGSFSATINWGDGATSAGTVTGGSGSFTLTGQHTYADEGTFILTVTASEILPGTATASTALGRATVTEADILSGTPITFAAAATVPFTGSVATFSDTNTTNVPGDFTATINWGDGVTTAGTIIGGAGSFTVSGTHTYATNGGFELIGSLPVTVTLADDPPGTATATANSTANVTAALAQASAVPALHVYGLLALAFVLGITAVSRLTGHV